MKCSFILKKVEYKSFILKTGKFLFFVKSNFSYLAVSLFHFQFLIDKIVVAAANIVRAE